MYHCSTHQAQSIPVLSHDLPKERLGPGPAPAQRIASALAVDPIPPRMFSGAEVKKNS